MVHFISYKKRMIQIFRTFSKMYLYLEFYEVRSISRFHKLVQYEPFDNNNFLSSKFAYFSTDFALLSTKLILRIVFFWFGKAEEDVANYDVNGNIKQFHINMGNFILESGLRIRGAKLRVLVYDVYIVRRFIPCIFASPIRMKY